VPATLRLFRNLLAFALIAFGMTMPAAAWNTHAASHLGNPVAVDEHHHHDEDGVRSGGHGHEAPDEGDDGHDHMPSLSASLSAIVDEGAATLAPPLTGVPQPSYAAAAPVALIEPPPARPPRTL
jgi:hypothetical protein